MATSAAGISLAFGGFTKLAAGIESKGSVEALRAYGFGPLKPAAAENTGEKLLSLPEGFKYNLLGKTGDPMSDGRKTPPQHDGMATFSVGGELRIVRNHEINDDLPLANVAIGASGHYDEEAGGGTTTLIIDPRTRLIERDFVSLSGTLNNCAGGPTPWGSWISCEETTLGAAKFLEDDDDDEMVGGFAKPHGYCFEVPAAANGPVDPVPLKEMGRFSHEAVAIDRRTGIVYMTEDSDPYCGFYRYAPKTAGKLADGGTLQILAIKDRPNYNTQYGQRQGTTLSTRWVTIDDPDPIAADTDEQAVFKQGARKGAAHFNKLEGSWADPNGRIYFISSSGGDNGGGQIWLFEPRGRDGGRLTLVYESPDREILDMPDNMCIDPHGPNLYLCEDSDYKGVGGTTENFVRILTPEGRIADLARNISTEFPSSEFAGGVFSPDGETYFVNIQEAGVTAAIWGDWRSFRG